MKLISNVSLGYGWLLIGRLTYVRSEEDMIVVAISRLMMFSISESFGIQKTERCSRFVDKVFLKSTTF